MTTRGHRAVGLISSLLAESRENPSTSPPPPEAMKVHETRSQAHANMEEEGKIGRKHRGEEGDQQASKNKKPKANGDANGRSAADVAADFEEFCKATREHLSIDQMRRILEANDQDPSGDDDAVVPKWQEMMFYGPLERCPMCNSQLSRKGVNYKCRGAYSVWTTCRYRTRNPRRRAQDITIPDEIQDPMVKDWVERQKSEKTYPHQELGTLDKPLTGMMISLSGRLSRTHQYWKAEIEKHGGKVANTVPGMNCLVVSPAERERGGSSKVVEAMEKGIPVVSEKWLIDSIEKQAVQPLEAYDVVSDLAPEGRGIPWDKQDPSEEALESLTAEIKLYGKRGVHRDSKLHEQGGTIFEKDGIIYNCAFYLCDQALEINDFCIMQLIQVPGSGLHLYAKKGRTGDDPRAEERLAEWSSVDDAVKEFARLFEELTGNAFEPWEREKKIEKKFCKFYPIDMDVGIDVRYGGLGIRQLGAASAHSKLDPFVAYFMKILCSQEIYRYALMEMGLDSPDLPIGMLSDVHLNRCEDMLLTFRERDLRSAPETEERNESRWFDFSNKWCNLMPTTRPFALKSMEELADYVAAPLETVKDINIASRLIGDMSAVTIDDPLFDRYTKLGCSISPVEKESEDYKMILEYLEKTYEPVNVGDVSYDVSVENIFAVELSACPSYDDVRKLPNKVLLWCGTRSSNLLRHLHKGFRPAICQIPAPGYMFGKAIVCSDAAAEAAKYGFTAVDRPEGFLVLAVASQGEQITEVSSSVEDTREFEEKKIGVKGVGRKKPDESEHFIWKDDVKVPCGRLVPSGFDNSPLEYNEYAVYDPKQVSIRFLVGVKYEEKNMEFESVEPE